MIDKLTHLILTNLQERIDLKDIDLAYLRSKIADYVKYNGLDSIARKYESSPSNLDKYVKMELKHLDLLNPPEAVAFFLYYKERLEFEKLSNEAFDFAKKRFLKKETPQVEYKEFEHRIYSLATALINEKSTRDWALFLMSETLNDLSFAFGKQSEMSVRMSHFARNISSDDLP